MGVIIPIEVICFLSLRRSDPTKLKYNAYDSLQGVSRCCLRGRVRLSQGPSEPHGKPVNPRGRSGLGGKGILPHWGPNHIIVLALTRRGPSGDFHVAVLNRNRTSCLPWVCIDFSFTTYSWTVEQ